MTNEELQAHIKAIGEAHARGEIEELDGRNNTGWQKPSCGTIAIDAPMEYQYRIKPQPREVFECSCGQLVWTTKFMPERGGHAVVAKFREVLE